MNKKVIVLTGVTRGCGRSLVDEFVAMGHQVLGCGRSRDALAALQRQFGAPHDFSVVDVSDDGQVAAWAKRLLDTYSVPDLLINNAATINPNAPLWEIDAAAFSEVIDINIKGVANTIRHFVPAMVQRGRGVVVNFSSGWGRSVSPDVAPYCATKWAIEGLTKALAAELPQGMAAVPLNPGIINTSMLQSCFGGGAASYPRPTDWAKRAAPFLTSLSPAENGQSLSVEG